MGQEYREMWGMSKLHKCFVYANPANFLRDYVFAHAIVRTFIITFERLWWLGEIPYDLKFSKAKMTIWGTASQSDSPPVADDMRRVWGNWLWSWDKTKRDLSVSSATKWKAITKVKLDSSWKCTVVGQEAKNTGCNTGNSY